MVIMRAQETAQIRSDTHLEIILICTDWLQLTCCLKKSWSAQKHFSNPPSALDEPIIALFFLLSDYWILILICVHATGSGFQIQDHYTMQYSTYIHRKEIAGCKILEV